MIGATEKLRRLRIGRISVDEEFEGLADESAGTWTGISSNACRPAAGSLPELWLRQDMPQAASARRSDKAAS